MKKIIEFLKSNFIIVKWTMWYFFALWLILTYIFKFDVFSYHYWWKFFHATLHGFYGFTFGLLMYTAIPIYIVTTIITYRKKSYVIQIPILDKIFAFIQKMPQKTTQKPQPEPENKKEPQQNEAPEFPSDLPAELRIPFMRAKQNKSLTGSMSVYNQPNKQIPIQNEPDKSNEPVIPIPTDFDIGDSFEDTSNSVPMFKDIDFDVPFDTPIATEKELENNTTKYLTNHHTEYETYRNFVATEKYFIYEHNDEDFWVMDGDSWFASGKQIDSPIRELIDTAKQNNLTPVIYLATTNIMDLDETIKNFESNGIKVIKDLDELV